jgi:ArsR family transcriptional regulator
MGQSKVSYHVRKLKEVGIVRGQKRGRRSFYTVTRDAAGELLGEAEDHLGVGGTAVSALTKPNQTPAI